MKRKNNNDENVCHVVESLKDKEKNKDACGRLGRKKQKKKKKRCYYYNNNNGCSWCLGVMVLQGL